MTTEHTSSSRVAAAPARAAPFTATGSSWPGAGATPAAAPRATARAPRTLAAPHGIACTSNPAAARSTGTAAVTSSTTITVCHRDSDTFFADMETKACPAANTHTGAAVVRARGAASTDADGHVDPVLPDVDADPGANTTTSAACLAVAGASRATADADANPDGRIGPVARHDPTEPVAVSGAMATVGTVP